MSIPHDYTPLQASYNGDKVTIKVGDHELSNLKYKKATQGVFQKIKDVFSRDYVSLKIGKTVIKVNIDDLAKALGTSKETIIKADKNKTLLNPVSVFLLKEKDKLGLSDTEIQDLSEQMNDIHRIAHLIMKKPDFDPNKEEQMVVTLSSGKRQFTITATLKGTDLKIHSNFGQKLGSGSFGEALLRVDLMNMQWSNDANAVLKVPKQLGNQEFKDCIDTLNQLNPRGNVLGMQMPVKEVKIKERGTENVYTTYSGPRYSGDCLALCDSLSPKDQLSAIYQLFHGVTHTHKMNRSHGDIKPSNAFINKKTDGFGAQLFLGDWDGCVNHLNILQDYDKSIHTSAFRFAADDDKRKEILQHYRTKYKKISKMLDIINYTNNVTSAVKLIEGLDPHEIGLSEKTINKIKNLPMTETEELVNSLKEDYTKVLIDLSENIQVLEQKADVAATVLTACSIILFRLPRVEGLKRVHELGVKKEALPSILKQCGLSDNTINLMMRGLEVDLKERPKIEELLHALKKDIDQLHPDLGAALAKRSLY